MNGWQDAISPLFVCMLARGREKGKCGCGGGLQGRQECSPLRSGDILVADVKPPAKQHFPVVVELATEG